MSHTFSRTDLVTIEVTRWVRDQVRDAAQAACVTQSQLLEELLQDRRRALFWAALEEETPDQGYLDELDEVDAAFATDSATDTEIAITDFESGR